MGMAWENRLNMGWGGWGGDEPDGRGRHAAGMCTGLERVLFCHHPLNQSPRVTHQPCSTKTRREEEKAARRSTEAPVSPRQGTVAWIWTPIFQSP